jgi:hypothetical protein
MALLGMVILGVYSIDTFSRYHLVTSDKRAKVQNEVSLVLEHMARTIALTIGDFKNYPLNLSSNTLTFWADSNQDGILNLTTGDNLSAYRYNATENAIRYCVNYTNSTSSCSSGWEFLSHYIVSNLTSSYITVNNTTNYVDISLSGCWKPSDPVSCGTSDNPSVTMNSSIKMLSVSVN